MCGGIENNKSGKEQGVCGGVENNKSGKEQGVCGGVENLLEDAGVDVGLHVLGCRVDILGTNCKKLLKVKMSGGGGGGASLQLQYV